MCGTILEPARRATAAVPPGPTPPAPRAAEPAPVVSLPVGPPPPAVPPPVTPKTTSGTVPPIGGPSLLGLDQSDNVDTFRDRAFSGLASYGNPEPKSAGKEILLTVVLVAALAGAGWWTYKNYIGVATTRKAAVTTPASESTSAPAENPAPTPAEKSEVKDAPAAAEH